MAVKIPTNAYYNYINGELVKGNSKTTKVICPGNDEIVAEVPLATKGQALEALDAASVAFPLWSSISLEERGEWIKKLATAITEERETLATLLMLETGKLYKHIKEEPMNIVRYLNAFYEQAKCNSEEIIRDTTGGKHMFMAVREPIGVVVSSLAWNFPMHNLATKLGPILASGCTAVIKPATNTPLSTMYVGEILHRINFPKGVVNFIVGEASEIGKTLCSSPIPAMISMIGSTKGGLQMIKDSTTSIKRFSMELGGNAPVIVTSSADLQAAVDLTMSRKIKDCGQTCVSPQRAIVHESVYDKFIKLCVEYAATAICGTMDENATMDPMITKPALQRIKDIVADAVEKGAVLECGGKSPDYKTHGNYYLPTVLSNVTRYMRAFNEEVFGPVLTVTKYSDLEDAIKMANDTEYGLSSYVWGSDINEINKVSRGLAFGIVNVNGPITGATYPHGGCKNSGIGKDGSKYSLDEYYYIKGLRVALK